MAAAGISLDTALQSCSYLFDQLPFCPHRSFTGGEHSCLEVLQEFLERISTHGSLQLLTDILGEVPKTPAVMQCSARRACRTFSSKDLAMHAKEARRPYLYLPESGNSLLRATSAAGSASVKMDSGRRPWHRAFTAAKAQINCSADSSFSTPCTSSRVLQRSAAGAYLLH